MTQQAPAWGRLPVELRERPQWLLAGPNEHGELKVPTSVDTSGRLCAGSSTDESTWLDFDYAAECAAEHGYGLGYVLSASDPFTCVDLDVKDAQNAPNNPEKWTTPEQWARYHSIVSALASYTEFSQSGKGVHVWCRGKIGDGRKRDGIEVYSQARFIACTGNAMHAVPIADRQDMLLHMVSQMPAGRDTGLALDDVDATCTDDELWERAANADNAEKFRDLCAGEWSKYGFPSQSEADLALMSMFTFYSRNDEQCRRMFRTTALGQREKSQKDDRYLDYTLKLIRGRQAKEDAAAAVVEGSVTALVRELEAKLAAERAAPPPVAPPSPAAAPTAVAPSEGQGLDWPPGMAGAIARFVYGSAPRPVKEVAIVAALGFLAGVCGKVWCIPGSGLNLYVILVARSAVGKEAMHSGLSALVGRLREGAPTCGQFIDFSDFASGPALAKACANNSSFCNVAGEFGKKLKRLAAEGERDGPMQQLRTLMTNLYQKSGPSSIVGGITYSNKDNNVASVNGVAYSMIGETTPGTLYDSLTETMMEDGFLSRFTIIEYDGDRPPLNPNPVVVPDAGLTHALQELCIQATTQLHNHTRCLLQRDVEAGVVMDAFDTECDQQINSTKDESWRQMWNRAHLKVCRIAGLLAVADNFKDPVIRAHHVHWALDVVRRDIKIMRSRIESGDVGLNDTSRERKLLSVLKDYLNGPPPTSYGVPAIMQRDFVVPRKYLQMRTCRVSCFANHQYGATRALDDALRSLEDSGWIVSMDKAKAAEAYTFQGKCYRVVNLPQSA
jgi:hypothetical protein